MSTYETIRLMNTILTLYYVEGLTQTEIAQRLNFSTAKVNRLLLQAREQGYVNITIRTPFQQLFELEDRLKAVFGLQDAIVIPAVAESSTSPLNNLGAAAADFLLARLRDGDILAITPGTTVQAVARALVATRQYQIQIVPALGASQGHIKSDMNYLANHMAEKLGGKAYQLHAPAFVETREHCEVVLSMAPVKEILDIARQATIGLLGVGTVDPETSRIAQFTALSAEDMQRIACDYGGVGEICAHVFDIEGRACGTEYMERVIGLTLSELRQIPFRIGVAASASKALPIYGALRGGYLHALITDEAAARGVLEIFDEKFRKIP
ncbi:Erythritol catabolism regulatory protein EryD [Anaerolineales bacterium]|nr:Erythritol catabolism regulatory protein EryD [Anaerolineales bacterium]